MYLKISFKYFIKAFKRTYSSPGNERDKFKSNMNKIKYLLEKPNLNQMYLCCIQIMTFCKPT